MEKRTKIIVIVMTLVSLGVIVGLALGLLLPGSSTIKLEVWPHPDDNSASPLIQYNPNDPTSWFSWNTRLSELLKEYRNDGIQPLPQYLQEVQRVVCSYDIRQVLGDKQVCDVPIQSYYPCTLNDNFQSTSPCLFFKLSKIRNWIPIPFNDTVAGLPQNMPEDLRSHIQSFNGAVEANNVWLSCEGEDPADKEFIGPLQYLPRRGFPTYYFPYNNNVGYLDPLVAVRFERPTTGVLIKIVCTAWAKNIKNDENEQQGTLHFSLQIN